MTFRSVLAVLCAAGFALATMTFVSTPAWAGEKAAKTEETKDAKAGTDDKEEKKDDSDSSKEKPK